MALRKRIEQAEKAARPKRLAFFSIHYGKATGRAWWNDRLSWENLTRPEFEKLKADLEAEGVKVISFNVIAVKPDGSAVNGWGEVENEEEN